MTAATTLASLEARLRTLGCEIPPTPESEGEPVNITPLGEASNSETLGEDKPWSTQFLKKEQWKRIFPFEKLEDDKVPSLEPPLQKEWADSNTKRKMREDLTSWFIGSILGQDKDKQMADKVIELAKKEAQALNLRKDQLATAKAFVQHLRYNIGPEASPPQVTNQMPPLAPTRLLMRTLPAKLQPNRNILHGIHAERDKGTVTTARLDDSKVMWQGLRDMYELHKWEVMRRNDWINRDAALTRYHATALLTAGEKDRTYESADIRDMTICTMPS